MLALALVFPAAAQDDPSDLSTLIGFDLEQLMGVEVVSASRTRSDTLEAPASIEVITSEMILRRGYQSLADVLRDLRWTDPSSGLPTGEYPTHFSFRGSHDLGQTKVLLMIDGVISNEVSNGWFVQYGYDMPLDDIERIEVVYGPGSALYGANAYAGIVHVITRDPIEATEEESAKLHTRFSVGQYGTFSPEMTTALRLGDDTALQISGRWFTTRGDRGIGRGDPGGYFTGNFEPTLVDTTEFGNVVNTRPNGEPWRIADGFDTSIDDLSMRIRLTHERITLGVDYWDRNEGLGSEVVGYEYFANTEGIPYTAHHRGTTVSARYETPVGDKSESMTLGYIRSTRILPETGFVYTYRYQSVADEGVIDKPKNYFGVGYLLGVDQTLTTAWSEDPKWGNRMTVGGQLWHQIREYFGIGLGPLIDTSSTIVEVAWEDEQRSVQPVFFSTNGALFVEDQQKLGEATTLTAGLRVDMDTVVESSINPRLALVTRPVEPFAVKLLYGEAFKAPTVFELRDEWRGNAELEPEKIRTGELELHGMTDNLHVEGSVFHSRARNLIRVATNPNPAAVPIGPNGELADYYQNIGRTQFTGVGLGAKVTLGDDLFLWANGSYTTGPNGDIDNISAMKGNFGGTLDIADRVWTNIGINAYGRIKAPDTNRYFHRKDAAFVDANYDYMTERQPDGYADGVTLLNVTLTGHDLLKGRSQIEPQLLFRNTLNADWATVGRQSGSGTRPVDQAAVQNPDGFIPPYHPQPRREITFRLGYRF